MLKSSTSIRFMQTSVSKILNSMIHLHNREITEKLPQLPGQTSWAIANPTQPLLPTDTIDTSDK